MANLFDTLKQNLQGTNVAPENRAGAATNNTAALQTLLRARSGKAISGGSQPAISNLQEQGANQEAAQQADALGTQGQIQQVQNTQALEAAQQEEQAQLASLDEEKISQQDDFTRRLDSLVSDFERQGDQLELNKNKSKLEQAGFLMRLADDKYTNQLAIEGKKGRLENEIAFNEALARATFADEYDLFTDDLEFRSMMKADNRQFREQLQAIDIESALAIAAAENSAASQSQMWTGVSGMVSGGAQAYAAGTKAPALPSNPTLPQAPAITSDTGRGQQEIK